jgi:hypothetical protein
MLILKHTPSVLNLTPIPLKLIPLKLTLTKVPLGQVPIHILALPHPLVQLGHLPLEALSHLGCHINNSNVNK